MVVDSANDDGALMDDFYLVFDRNNLYRIYVENPRMMYQRFYHLQVLSPYWSLCVCCLLLFFILAREICLSLSPISL